MNEYTNIACYYVWQCIGQWHRKQVGLYTILPIPILYSVWHTKGGSGGGSYLAQQSCNSTAIVWALQVGGGNKTMTDSCTKALK